MIDWPVHYSLLLAKSQICKFLAVKTDKHSQIWKELVSIKLYAFIQLIVELMSFLSPSFWIIPTLNCTFLMGNIIVFHLRLEAIWNQIYLHFVIWVIVWSVSATEGEDSRLYSLKGSFTGEKNVNDNKW